MTRPLEMQYAAMDNQPTSPQGYSGYTAQPEDVAYGSRKRTRSISEGLQNPQYMRNQFDESNGRYRSTPSTNWTNQAIARPTPAPQPSTGFRSQQVQQPALDFDTSYNNHMVNMSPNGIPLTARNSGGMGLDAAIARANEQDSHIESSIEWNEQAVDE